MLPNQAPKPKDWTDKDKMVCTSRWLEALSTALYEWCDKHPKTGIPIGKKGDPCFECPAGIRCPAYCDDSHLKRYTEFYALENFKVVERFSGSSMTIIDSILKEVCDANATKDISQA